MNSVWLVFYGEVLLFVVIDLWKLCFKYLCIDIKYMLVNKVLLRWVFLYLYNVFIDGSDVMWYKVIM